MKSKADNVDDLLTVSVELNISRLVKKTDYDVKVNDIKGKMLSISGLATTSVLNVATYEIPKVSDLVKQTHYEVKISNIKSKFFITSGYNKFKNNILDAKVKNKRLVHESDISGFIKKFYLDKKIETSAAKAELKTEQNEIVRLQTYDLSLFIAQRYYFNDGSQSFLICQPIFNTSTMPAGVIEIIAAWQSKEL